MNCKYFLLLCGLPLHVLCFGGQKSTLLMKLSLSFFIFCSLVLLVSYLRNHCLTMSWRFTLVFSSKSFMFQLLRLDFWSILIFTYGIWRDPTFFFNMWLSSCASTISWKQFDFVMLSQACIPEINHIIGHYLLILFSIVVNMFMRNISL